MAEIQGTAKERLARLDSLPFERAGAPDQLVSGAAGSLKDIWKHRELLGLLTKRELKARYKDSSLGFVWSLIKPLTQLLIYYVVVGKFLGAERGIPNFAVYIFAGLTIYTLFSEIVGGGTSSIIANSGLVKKVYLPREIFPLSAVGSALFNLCIQLLILVVTAALVGTLTFGPHLLYGVGALVVIIIYGTALGILLSALNVFLRDVQYLVEVVLMLFMWGSPILYHWTFAIKYMPEWLAQVYLNNPITLAVIGFQEALWSPNSSSDSLDGLALRLVVAAAVGLVFLFISQRVFSRLQGNFAQEL
ncbi:ABC transporter permease [Agreia sp. Leaf210]|uniref:ABC transporter permease n=1 Tax=Agreia sp. Leaf210 TaxID=1735682 RepID=UPI0006FB869C|nr:ABC transporter permease [Agreia sp. Leaf210]KQM60566.1 sugar ABC transporter [Agreia sp. Leaf210]